MMGAARGDVEYKGSTLEVFTRLANKAGYQVIVPQVRTLQLLASLQWQLLLRVLRRHAHAQGSNTSVMGRFLVGQLQ
jgi:hypothetical protein